MEASAQNGFSYTLIRVGKLRGGGGEQGLGFEFYDQNRNPLEVRFNIFVGTGGATPACVCFFPWL